MPGAPLEPGKALKDGGGPYGFPGAIEGHGKYRASIMRRFADCAGCLSRHSPPYGLYAIFAPALSKSFLPRWSYRVAVLSPNSRCVSAMTKEAPRDDDQGL